MKSIIATKVTHYDDWEAVLPIAQYVINSAINDYGVSPAMCMFGEQIPMPTVMYDRPPPDFEHKDAASRSFLQALAHNMRNMRKGILKVDATINPKCDSKSNLKHDYQLVYVKIGPRVNNH